MKILGFWNRKPPQSGLNESGAAEEGSSQCDNANPTSSFQFQNQGALNLAEDLPFYAQQQVVRRGPKKWPSARVSRLNDLRKELSMAKSGTSANFKHPLQEPRSSSNLCLAKVAELLAAGEINGGDEKWGQNNLGLGWLSTSTSFNNDRNSSAEKRTNLARRNESDSMAESSFTG
jgi:hypothetical protein